MGKFKEFIKKYYFKNIILKWISFVWGAPLFIGAVKEFLNNYEEVSIPNFIKLFLEYDFPWLMIGFLVFIIINIRAIYKLWKENDSKSFVPFNPLPKNSFESNLSPKQINFVKTVEDILTNHGIKNSFKDKYNNGYKQLDKDIKLSSSDYNSAFAEIVNEHILLDLKKYKRTPPENLIKELKECFSSLEYFSNSSKNSKNELEEIICNLEGKITSLKAYII